MAKKKSPALRSVGNALTSPQTRQERYLANIAGLVATKPEYPFTRLERYLDAIAQSTGGSAEAIEELKQNKLNVYGRGVNLLDNWYFVGGGSQQGGGQFPINQRGQTSYSGAGNGIDMWTSTVASTIIVTTNGVSIVGSETSVGNIVQRLLGLSKYLGKTYTASILLAGGVLATGIVSFPAAASGVVIVGTVYFTGGRIEIGCNTERNWLYFNIIVNANTTVTIEAVKLELGDTQTLAHQENGEWVLNDLPPNFQQELAKCQRYFQVFRDQNLRPAYGMDYRPPMAKEQPTQSSFVLDGVTYYTASAEL